MLDPFLPPQPQSQSLTDKKALLRHGDPQGGVLSPTLFLIFIMNDRSKSYQKKCKQPYIYADDLVMWCKEEHASTVTYRVQFAADTFTAWAEECCVATNKEISSTILFNLSSKKAGVVSHLETHYSGVIEEATVHQAHAILT